MLDPEKGEIFIVERIEKVRVMSGSEIRLGDFEGPNRGETVEDSDKRGGYTNHNFDAKTGKAKKSKRKQQTCRNCGQAGHRRDTCPTVATTNSAAA